jgi:hypothetical protein
MEAMSANEIPIPAGRTHCTTLRGTGDTVAMVSRPHQLVHPTGKLRTELHNV